MDHQNPPPPIVVPPAVIPAGYQLVPQDFYAGMDPKKKMFAQFGALGVVALAAFALIGISLYTVKFISGEVERNRETFREESLQNRIDNREADRLNRETLAEMTRVLNNSAESMNRATDLLYRVSEKVNKSVEKLEKAADKLEETSIPPPRLKGTGGLP